MQALISYAVHFLTKRGATMLQTPFVMNKSLMGKVHAAASGAARLISSERSCRLSSEREPNP